MNISEPANGISDGATLNNYITRTDYTYKAELLPSKVFVNMTTSETTKNLLDGTNNLATNTYDSFYNVTEQMTNFSGIGTKTVQSTYDNNPSGGYIGRATNQKTILQNSGDTFSTEEQYTYTGFTPTQIKRKGNGTPFITENLVYDTYGNVTSKQLVTADGSRTELMQYDASHRFVTKFIDVEGLEINSTYNATTGNILTKTNPFGQDSTYAYDVWGRIIQATDHLGNYETTSYVHYGTDVIVTEGDNQGHEQKTTTNALGLTTLVTEKDVLGQVIGKSYQYDVYDRIIGESEPGIGSYAQWNLTEYDTYSRVKKITDYTGKITTTTYNGLIKTINDGIKTVVATQNALGNLASMQDPGGTINYTYFANGKLRSAGIGGATQTIQRDGWGRKIQLIDPSSGTYTYTYNLFGEVLTQGTPKGLLLTRMELQQVRC